MKSRCITASLPIHLHRTRIFPVVLYEHGTWSLTLSEKYRLRLSKNRVLRKMLGHKTDKVTEKWRRLHNEELYDCTPHKIWFRWSNEELLGLVRDSGQIMDRVRLQTLHTFGMPTLTFTSVTTLVYMCNNILSLCMSSLDILRGRQICFCPRWSHAITYYHSQHYNSIRNRASYSDDWSFQPWKTHNLLLSKRSGMKQIPFPQVPTGQVQHVNENSIFLSLKSTNCDCTGSSHCTQRASWQLHVPCTDLHTTTSQTTDIFIKPYYLR
jgi:hypothetical protein